MSTTIKLGTRGSQLARWQTDWVKKELLKDYPDLNFEIVIVQTTGDKILGTALSRIGDKGLFTRELDTALLSGRIDLAVHSMKDVPTAFPSDLEIVCVTERWDPRDAFISGLYKNLEDLPRNATVATGSLRRKAQLLHHRPDLEIIDIRGNVNTRLKKFAESDWDAMILACAGLDRLNLSDHISQRLSVQTMLPAVGQGCFAVMARKDDGNILEITRHLHRPQVAEAVSAERAFLKRLEGGCQVPIGALAETNEKNNFTLQGCVASLDGNNFFRDKVQFDQGDAVLSGELLATTLIESGAGEVLENIRTHLE